MIAIRSETGVRFPMRIAGRTKLLRRRRLHELEPRFYAVDVQVFLQKTCYEVHGHVFITNNPIIWK